MNTTRFRLQLSHAAFVACLLAALLTGCTGTADPDGANPLSQAIDAGLDDLFGGVPAGTPSPAEQPAPEQAASPGTPIRALPQSVAVQVSSIKPITLKAVAADEAALAYTVLEPPRHGVLDGTPPNVTYIPALAYAGPDAFTFTCSDGIAESSPATVEISVEAWAPPIGIPPPPFGIREVAPARPEPWAGEVAGFYYVDYERGSDTRTFGSPDNPRKTVPDVLPAGSVVEVHGMYAYAPQGYQEIECQGTSDRPVFIRGQALSRRPEWLRALYIRGSYCIVENIVCRDDDGVNQGSVWFLAPANHAVLRHCDVSGNRNRGGGVRAVSWDENIVHNIVIYANAIHDHGDWSNRSGDQDVHGVAVSANAHHIWILDNEIYHNSGDGIQINAGSRAKQSTTHHIYVGRNVSHDNKQTGMWTKQAEDVIFSQNTCYNHRPSDSSNGAGMGFQYDPENVWFLYNHIYHCSYGISTESGSDLGYGRNSYLIGNVIHDIHHDPTYPYNPDTAWSNAAIMLVGGATAHVVNNSIDNVDAGINCPASLSLRIQNNIISNVTEPQGNHVFLEFAAAAETSVMESTLLHQASGGVRIKWASAAQDLAQFQASSRGAGCVSADPQFRDPASGDLRLVPTSAGVNAGTTPEAFRLFFERYGIDLNADAAGMPRPSGGEIDIGAFEQ